MSSSTRFRPPDLLLRVGLWRHKYGPSMGARFSWAWREAFVPFVGFEMKRVLMFGLGLKEGVMVPSLTT